jgi:tripartite-type tricarboxylate transporter receptor subunit TctC
MKKLAIAILWILAPFIVHAQEIFPNKPIKVIIPFPAGGPSDTIGRIYANQLRLALNGATVIIENKPGAGTSVGTAALASSKPDGYTLMVVSSMTVSSLPFLQKNLPYDVFKDLMVINQFAATPLALIINPKLPVKDARELITYAANNPEKIRYGSSGNGQAYHLAGELLSQRTGINILHIPYKGSAPTMTDLVGGNIDMAFDTPSAAIPFLPGNRLRILAVTGQTRLPQFPDVPTLTEQGVKDYNIELRWAIFARNGTPPAIAQRLHAVSTQIASDPAVIEALSKISIQPSSCSTLAICANNFKSDSDLVGKLIQSIGLKPE